MGTGLQKLFGHKRRVFYSFHYEPDSWRVSQVREIGTIEGNQPANDNDWEVVKKGGDRAIRSWIDDQLHGRSCTVVLVGTGTAGRKWINYEIVKSWNDEKGVVGIHIHGLKDRDGRVSTKGKNPFSAIDYGRAREKLSSVVKCYDPVGGAAENDTRGLRRISLGWSKKRSRYGADGLSTSSRARVGSSSPNSPVPRLAVDTLRESLGACKGGAATVLSNERG